MFSTKSYLTPNQVAELLMVSPSAIRLWAEKGQLKTMTTVGGHRRFKLDDIKQFAIENNIQLNLEESDKQRILIVDDEPLYAGFIKDALSLEYENIDIEICYNGFAAGLKVNCFKPTIIILDLMMPAIDGFEFCNQIKQDPLLNHIRIIAITGYVTEENQQKIIKSGAEICLEKPLNIGKLIKQLNLECKNIK